MGFAIKLFRIVICEVSPGNLVLEWECNASSKACKSSTKPSQNTDQFSRLVMTLDVAVVKVERSCY